MNELVYPYRFKTIDEFTTEYGQNWRRYVNFNNSGQMDYLCGSVFPFINVEEGISHSYCGWHISKKMLTKNTNETSKKYFNIVSHKLTNYPYRFKTEQEFEQLNGVNWRHSAYDGVAWNCIMDSLLGKDITIQITDKMISGKISYTVINGQNVRHWVVVGKMLEKNKIAEPNYKPKRIIHTI